MKFIKVSDTLVLNTDKIISLRINDTKIKIEITVVPAADDESSDTMFFAFAKEKTLESLKERLEELYQQILN